MSEQLRSRVAELMGPAREELASLVAIPSVADARLFPPEECQRAAQWVLDKFAELGFSDAHLERTADGSDAVVGSRSSGDPAAPTVLLYAHYDVQPPLDDDAWKTPPFELTEVDGRWYGRGAADCKGNILAHLIALRALGDDIPVNLKLVVEGSEEQGTGGLEEFVPEHPSCWRPTPSWSATPATLRSDVRPRRSRSAGWSTSWSPSTPSRGRCTPGCSAVRLRMRWPR